MKKIFHDERIIQESRKQNSFGFILLYYGLLLVLLYRQFILQEPVSKYWDIAVLFFSVTFILAAKRISSGILTNKVSFVSNIIPAIIGAITFTIINYIWMGNRAPVVLLTSGLVFFFGIYGITLLFQYISKKKNDSMLIDD